jgi:hypothetical protein
VIYTLTGSASGYTLTNIMVYGGWKDAGRDQQAYTVYYSKMATPSTFVLLRSINYNPANPSNAQSATRAAVKFDFLTPTSENGYVGYAEISLSGMPTPVVASNPTNITAQVAGNALLLSWPSDHTGWRLQVQTNSLAQGLGTNWVTVANSTLTNQIVAPIDPANGGVFYRLVYP